MVAKISSTGRQTRWQHALAAAADAPPTIWRERFVFAVLAIFIWPVIAVGVVGGYGFLVWMWQLAFGPPGPPGL